MKHPFKKIEKKVAVVGCKHTTRDFILGLESYGFSIDHCVTISPKKGRRHKVFGYYDLQPLLDSKSIPYTIAEKYSLKSEQDMEKLLDLKLDMLLVIGWQRLIPDWFLKSLSAGAFGMHGSSKPLPYGRGRSPLNWSLIQDKKIFFTHLFRYKPGIDDGDIVDFQIFDITNLDNCLTLHYKNLVSMLKLCVKNLPSLLDGTAKLKAQPEDGVSYYPKRRPRDGIIYWNDSSQEIYNLIRAVTKPYPGAFTYLCDDPMKKVYIWRAIPFDSHIRWDAESGEIVQVFYDGSFIVKTGDTSIIVLESEGYEFTEKDKGKFLGHLNKPRKLWGELPRLHAPTRA